MWPPAHESHGLEVVDDHGGVRRIDPQRPGQLAHRHWLSRESTDRPGAPEADADRVGDLAAPLVVEHEVGHQQPDLACGL
jgi:hypothetical protein